MNFAQMLAFGPRIVNGTGSGGTNELKISSGNGGRRAVVDGKTVSHMIYKEAFQVHDWVANTAKIAEAAGVRRKSALDMLTTLVSRGAG